MFQDKIDIKNYCNHFKLQLADVSFIYTVDWTSKNHLSQNFLKKKFFWKKKLYINKIKNFSKLWANKSN